MTDLNDMVAAYLAKGGSIKTVQPGATALGLTDRQWSQVVRGNASATEPDLGYARFEAAQQAGFVGDHNFAVEIAAGLHDGALK